MIDVIDGRVKFQKKINQENRDLVLLYFLENPGSTVMDCSRAIGLSRWTVTKHVKAIQQEQQTRKAI